MNKRDIVKQVLADRFRLSPRHASSEAYAPTNIALCKYWGKRNTELNLPVTSSLSYSVNDYGATVQLAVIDAAHDHIVLNQQSVDLHSAFATRLIAYLNLFRDEATHFNITIHSTVPIAAGLASSACGFAAVAKALDALYGLHCSSTELSLLARLGSGSACRSLFDGFVLWHAGTREDGMDSVAESLDIAWPEFQMMFLIVDENAKKISSREAMKRTVETSPLYASWPARVSDDLTVMMNALKEKNFERLASAAEKNALAMHATMMAANPPIQYSSPETIAMMQTIWKLRHEGLPIYFTQDAGPNLKLMFLEKDRAMVEKSISAAKF